MHFCQDLRHYFTGCVGLDFSRNEKKCNIKKAKINVLFRKNLQKTDPFRRVISNKQFILAVEEYKYDFPPPKYTFLNLWELLDARDA